jgi:hypothetical protein
MGLTNTPSDLLPGTLELLILKTLVSGAKPGDGIVEHLRLTSDDVLRVGESALYPALQRLLFNGWVKAEWASLRRGTTRLARFSACWRVAPETIGAPGHDRSVIISSCPELRNLMRPLQR